MGGFFLGPKHFLQVREYLFFCPGVSLHCLHWCTQICTNHLLAQVCVGPGMWIEAGKASIIPFLALIHPSLLYFVPIPPSALSAHPASSTIGLIGSSDSHPVLLSFASMLLKLPLQSMLPKAIYKWPCILLSLTPSCSGQILEKIGLQVSVRWLWTEVYGTCKYMYQNPSKFVQEKKLLGEDNSAWKDTKGFQSLYPPSTLVRSTAFNDCFSFFKKCSCSFLQEVVWAFFFLTGIYM